MTFSYISNTIDPTWCIGNSLSTINYNFTALDVALSALSAYTHTSVDFLSTTMIAVSSNLQTQINYLSTSLVSTSAFIQTEINYLSTSLVSTSAFIQTEINYLSANAPIQYYSEGTLTQASNGTITWNLSANGRSARVVLTKNGFLNNPEGSIAGEIGNLIVQSNGVSGYSLTGFGSGWVFSTGVTLSSMSVGVSALNRIEMFNDQSLRYLGTMFKY